MARRLKVAGNLTLTLAVIGPAASVFATLAVQGGSQPHLLPVSQGLASVTCAAGG
jgi:hypothetical protein